LLKFTLVKPSKKKKKKEEEEATFRVKTLSIFYFYNMIWGIFVLFFSFSHLCVCVRVCVVFVCLLNLLHFSLHPFFSSLVYYFAG